MKTIEKPQLSPLHLGEQFKVLEVTGNAKADMPIHYCTSEAVVIIQQGRAILIIDEAEKELTPGMSVLLPAKKKHSLKIIEPLKAQVVMAKEASIEFATEIISK